MSREESTGGDPPPLRPGGRTTQYAQSPGKAAPCSVRVLPGLFYFCKKEMIWHFS